jgi:hypothetical protein
MREEGYYWVKRKDYLFEWIICYWHIVGNKGFWILMGIENARLYDSDFKEIDEQRLIPKLKKKEVKDWNWYVNEYFDGGSLVRYKDWTIEAVKAIINKEDYNSLHFEIKIGLFKFICDDLKYNWFDTFYFIKVNHIPEDVTLSMILPPDFVKSLKQ